VALRSPRPWALLLCALAFACTEGEAEQNVDTAPDASVAQEAQDASVPGACCVELVGAAVEPSLLCEGPSPELASPVVALKVTVAHSTLTLRAARGGERLELQAYEAAGIGTYPNPSIEYLSESGEQLGNRGMNGALTVTTWEAVGGQVRGSFYGAVRGGADGGGADLLLEGTFCALRVAPP
jgi:hypothetical protein